MTEHGEGPRLEDSERAEASTSYAGEPTAPSAPVIMTPRVEWDRRFLRLAGEVAGWSKDPSTQAGAVVVTEDRRRLSVGYNGFPRRIADSEARYNDRPTKYKLVVHAEVNAILNADFSLEGGSLYCLPFTPCNECAKAIIQAGIARVVTPPIDNPSRWSESMSLGMAMLSEAGIPLDQVTLQ